MDPLHAWLRVIEEVIVFFRVLTTESWAALGIDSQTLVIQLQGILNRLGGLLEETSSESGPPPTYSRHRRYCFEFPRETIAEDTAGNEGQFHLARVRVYQRVVPEEVQLDSDSDVPDLV